MFAQESLLVRQTGNETRVDKPADLISIEIYHHRDNRIILNPQVAIDQYLIGFIVVTPPEGNANELATVNRGGVFDLFCADTHQDIGAFFSEFELQGLLPLMQNRLAAVDHCEIIALFEESGAAIKVFLNVRVLCVWLEIE